MPSETTQMLVRDPDSSADSSAESIAEIWRKAGLTKLADSSSQMVKSEQAALDYTELSPQDHRLFTEFMSEESSLDQLQIPPHPDAASIMIAAREQGLFDKLVVHTRPSTGESLLVGSITSKVSTRRFALAQWGESLTSLKYLRSRRLWHPQWRPSGTNWAIVQTVLVVLAVAGITRVGLNLTDLWPLFFLLVWGCIYLGSKWLMANVKGSVMLRKSFTGFAVLSGVIIAPFNIYWWNTTDHTVTATVCGSEGDDVLVTDEGEFTVLPEAMGPGIYEHFDGSNSGYYRFDPATGREYFEYAELPSLNGTTVQITYHGEADMPDIIPDFMEVGNEVDEGNPPYATAVEILDESELAGACN